MATTEGTEIPPPEENKPKEPGSRPWEERSRQAGSQIRVFALLVGIDNYLAPVKKLKGCVRDVEKIETYLRAEYGDKEAKPVVTALPPLNGESPLQKEVDGRLHLCVLKNEQATYGNIIHAFREHLGFATGKDTVWFHFSGHGTEQFTADEFLKHTDANGRVSSIEPNGKDQSLVCYVKKDSTSPQYLADKEIAVLLDEVARARSKKGQYPHMVVSLDSCHSGSGTRDFQEPAELQHRSHDLLETSTREDAARELKRRKKAVPKIRTLDSYMDGYYSKKGNLEIPVAEHVLLSACQTIETAGDLPSGGVFTSSLIAALENARKEKKNLHYAQLFTKARIEAHSLRSKQQPQFETIGGFDPYTCFLEGWPLGTPDKYEVFSKGKDWYVRCGAIHGLPPQASEKIKVKVVPAGSDAVEAFAFIEKVGAQHSKLTFPSTPSLKPKGDYLAEILSLPAAPIYVSAAGDKKTIDALIAAWDSSKNILLAEKGKPSETPSIHIEANPKGDFVISNAITQEKFSEVPAESGNGALDTRIQLVKEDLNKIVHWKRTIALDNPSTRIRNKFGFELMVTDKNKKTTAYSDKEVHIIGSEENLLNNKFLGINFQVKLKDNSQDLFFYAFDLSSSCAITFKNDEEKVARSQSMNAGDTMLLRSKPYGWGLGEQDTEAVRWFKLFVTTEELDYHQLVQKGLGGSRDEEADLFEPDLISEDWCAETIKVVLTRKQEA